MYKLFYALKTASMGVRVILEEIGAPYELIQTTVDREKPRPREQMAINPNGWVPVLLGEGGTIYDKPRSLCIYATGILMSSRHRLLITPLMRFFYRRSSTSLTPFRMHFN